MAEIALGRVISGPREISRDALMERAACAATGLGELGVGTGDAIGIVLRNHGQPQRRAAALYRCRSYSASHLLMDKVFGIAPDRVVRAVITGPRGAVIYEYYGATETGAFIIHGAEEALAKPGTCRAATAR